MPAFAPTMLTAAQLAARWQIDASTVYRMCLRGEIPCRRLGKLVRIPLAHVERVEQGEASPRPAGDEAAACAAPAPAAGGSPRPVPAIPFDPGARATRILAGLRRS